MKTMWLVVVVALVHVLAIGGFALIQGCGTPMGTRSATTSEYVMPPAPAVDMPAPRPMPAPMPAPAQRVQAPDMPPAKSWPAETTTYTVRAGDSLSKIASRYGLTTDEIMALNQLRDKNIVRVGQKLMLPGRIDVTAAPAPAPATPRAASSAAAAPADGNYTVQPGDSLSVLAKRFGTSVAAIKKANNLTSDAIFVGKKLRIDGSPAPATAPEAPARQLPPPSTALAPVVPDAPAAPAAPDMPAAPAAPSAAAPAAPSAAAPSAAAGDGFRIYEVGQGDDLYSVSLMWNVSLTRLRELNNLTDTTLTPGQKLKIPVSE